MKDLKDLKVGDKVWTIQHGWSEVTEFRDGFDHPIVVETEENDRESYDISGKRYETDAYPSLFLTNPFKQQVKEMLLSTNGFDWCTRDAIIANNSIYVKSGWKYAKEITEPTQVELTLEQIAEKFGCDVNQLKIKK